VWNSHANESELVPHDDMTLTWAELARHFALHK
jgi:hypothetical protein